MMKQSPSNPSQETVPSQILHVIGTYFFRLLGANLLFLITSLPIVTIPAALCGLHAVVQRYYRNIYSTTVFHTFFTEFKTDFFKRTGLCALVIAVPVLIALLVKNFVNSTILLVVYAIGFLAAIIVLNWFIPQLVLLNLNPVQALKNALILTTVESKTNFILMVLYAISLTVLVYIWPLSAFLLLFLPVLQALLVTGLVMPVFQARLIHDTPDQADVPPSSNNSGE